MQSLVEDPLARLVAGQMEEAVSHGADIPELAALTIDAVLAECVAVLEVRAAQHRDDRARAVVLDCADALLSVQFNGTCSSPVSVGPVGRHRQSP
jgi:hypothetical protein